MKSVRGYFHPEELKSTSGEEEVHLFPPLCISHALSRRILVHGWQRMRHFPALGEDSIRFDCRVRCAMNASIFVENIRNAR